MKKEEVVRLRIEKETKKKLRELAKKENRTMSGWINDKIKSSK